MAKSPNENAYYKARKLIDKVLEPKITAMVETFNEHLKSEGFIAIATINWEFHPIKDKKEIDDDEQD